MEIICQILEKNFCGLGYWQISAAHYCGCGRMIWLFTTILIMMNYYPITATYLSTHMLPAATTYYYSICICSIYIMIYICICVYICMSMYVLCYVMKCCVSHVCSVLSSLALSSQPVWVGIGWQGVLVYIYTYIV